MKKLLLIPSLILLSGAVFAQAMDQTIATVNYSVGAGAKTQPILLSKIKAELIELEKKSGTKITVDQRKQFVEAKVREVLFQQMCDAEKLTTTEQEMSQALLYGTGGKFSEQEVYAEYAKKGIGVEEVKSMVKTQLLQLKWVQLKYSAKLKEIAPPTEEEIFKTYDLMKSQMTRPDAVRIAMMVVAIDSKTTSAQAKAAAEKLYQQVKGNVSKFNEVMFKAADGKAEYKTVTESFVGKKPESIQALGQVFYDKVFSMKAKDIAGPVELTGQINGYAVVLVNDVYPQTQLELTDTLLPGQGKNIHDLLRDQLSQNKIVQSTSALFSADIEAARNKYVKYVIAPEKLDSVLSW